MSQILDVTLQNLLIRAVDGDQDAWDDIDMPQRPLVVGWLHRQPVADRDSMVSWKGRGSKRQWSAIFHDPSPKSPYPERRKRSDPTQSQSGRFGDCGGDDPICASHGRTRVPCRSDRKIHLRHVDRLRGIDPADLIDFNRHWYGRNAQ
jgi:hypothetical protein